MTDNEIPCFLEQLMEALSLTNNLYEKDPEAGINWFQTPNDFLFGSTPFEVCLRGDGDILIEWLREKTQKDT